MAAICYNFRLTPEEYLDMDQGAADGMFRYLERLNEKKSK